MKLIFEEYIKANLRLNEAPTKTSTKTDSSIKFKDPSSLGSLSKVNQKPEDLMQPEDFGKKLSKSNIEKTLSKGKMPTGASDVYRTMLNKIADITDKNSDISTYNTTDNATPEPVTPKNLPMLINKSLTKTDKKDIQRKIKVNWMQVKDLPGYAVEQIRGAFRPLFDSIMNNKLEDINVATDLMGMSPKTDIKQLIGYIAKYGIKDDAFSLEAFDIDPNLYHIEKAAVYNWDGVAYLILKENLFGQTFYYIYSGNGRSTKIQKKEQDYIK